MVMLAISFLYSLRIILSISMICMVKPILPAFVNHSAWNGNVSEYDLSGQTSPAWTDSLSGHDWTTSNSTVTERPSRVRRNVTFTKILLSQFLYLKLYNQFDIVAKIDKNKYNQFGSYHRKFGHVS